MRRSDPLKTAREKPAAPGGRSMTERRILDGALRALAHRGVRRLAMSDVCQEAGVSRATIYRYFATMDRLLERLSDFILQTTEERLAAATAAQNDPIEKLRAVLRYVANYTSENPTTGLLEIDPLFVIEFLNSRFDRHVEAMQRAVAPLCKLLREEGLPDLDEAMLAQLIVRCQLSSILVPVDQTWLEFPDRVADFIRACRPASAGSMAAA
jgi:AcrR family transcriptional regulator